MDTIWADTFADASGPKYRAVIDRIRRGIRTGELAVGEKLPPVRELAYQLDITPGTVARAYKLLTDEGVLLAEVGRGTFVAPADRRDSEDVADSEPEFRHDVAPHNSEAGDGYHVNLFSPHLPSVGQAGLIRELLGEIAKAPPSGMMHYPSREGSRPAREAAARWLSASTVGRVRESDVVLANGGQNALCLVLQTVLRGRRPVVLVEELSYPGFRRAAELLRAEVVPVPMDAEGLIPEALEAAARQHDAQILCTSPEAHNPTLTHTPQARRQALVDVARRCDFQILEDNCYHVSEASGPGYRLLAPERSWYVTSISKSITPALRIGFALAPRERTAQLRRAAEHGFFGIATPLTDLMARLLVDPRLAALTDKVHGVIRDYVQCAVNALGGHQLVWRSDVPFLWLPLPLGWRAGAFVQAAEAEGVRVRSAEDFVQRNARAPHAVRLAINAGVSLDTFEQAMQRLCALLDSPSELIAI
ncbi:aminotransferase-like domain-containing protein [Pseudodonghicola flavimaris]|uniref:PLP-dependent aminotransferase family protein n=1 Tax=Pseudodonghicola flavimaris TaxID=3050036 RepID=A0ABT7F6Y1_9RHOB|nr:PLP-dependent aminotransferase family protein [Pseudodonghicola flavimaris]MDK3020358.1 PLP-dependent aminotransferase family protein [Pseudodonghicola flavimaris]